MRQEAGAGDAFMTRKILVLNISPEEYKKKLKKIVRQEALWHDPVSKILDEAWSLLLSLNQNEEE